MPLTREGLLLIISGPSGVGKGTVCRALMERNDNMRFSVSWHHQAAPAWRSGRIALLLQDAGRI